MNVRVHRGFSHGLPEGWERDLNCAACTAERKQGTAPIIRPGSMKPGREVELADMEIAVIDIALKRYRSWLHREAKRKKNDPDYSVAVTAATLIEIDAALKKIGTVV